MAPPLPRWMTCLGWPRGRGAKADIRAPSRDGIEREISGAERLGAVYPAACEPDYSVCLAAIDAPPTLICLRGRRDLLDLPAIAMVGARDAWAADSRVACDLSRELGLADFMIISGMARGVDGEAHAASMEPGAVAVIAGGIDKIYPPQHEQLYTLLAERGCFVSDAPLGKVAQARDFPKRNRIISGLSLGPVVVEAMEKSGSLIPAHFALEQRREVMAVPGAPLEPRCRGANRR